MILFISSVYSCILEQLNIIVVVCDLNRVLKPCWYAVNFVSERPWVRTQANTNIVLEIGHTA